MIMLVNLLPKEKLEELRFKIEKLCSEYSFVVSTTDLPAEALRHVPPNEKIVIVTQMPCGCPVGSHCIGHMSAFPCPHNTE